MSSNPLHAIMNPSSIAFVGASNNFTKMGSLQCLNLMHSGFSGDILPVHPKEETVLGKKAYRFIKDLPYAPDLAVLVVPTGLVPDMLEDFGKLGTKYAVIISGGFKETGKAGQDLESRISDIARRYGMRFVGPNCVGIINTQLPLNMTIVPVQDYNGKLGIASQSGTYVTQTLPYLHKQGITISKAISIGNGTSIDIVDCLRYLGDDEQTTAIALYIEGIKRAGDFLEVAREISARKPIVAQYVGGTEAGARAVSSHTGSMAGPDYVYDGLFKQAGIIRADTIGDVYKMGWALASQPPLEGSRISILTNSGGPSTGIASTCNKHGLDVPEFSDEVQKKVRQFIPGHASARNPVDLTFHMDMSAMTDKIPRVLFDADEIDGVIIHGIMDTGWMDMLFPIMEPIMDISKEDFLELRKADIGGLVDISSRHGKPLIVSSFLGEEDHAVRAFKKNGIPTFDSPEMAGRAMAALYEHFLIRNRPHDKPNNNVKMPENVKAIVDGVDTEAFDEYTAKKILRAYGIPTTDEAIASTLDEAVGYARSIGYPVALKVCSPYIMHKTEQGMVHLGIKDDESLEKAFNSIRNKDGDSAILVSEMLKGDREFMAGMSYAPGFPPCIMFGLGGIFTEALKDNAIRLAPLSHSDAISMMDTLSSRALLGPYRGMKPVDMDAVASMLVALGRLALDFPQIREIDLNPIIITDGMPKVADALFVRQ
ncbi:MAG: acetate--CoA ligase family protein [Thermodesulfobacteriota bacterium]|nr:acetate--CoA ligase family protein [Thermodesulfobacteriota bacterium]